MRKISVAEAKDQLSKYLHQAEKDEIIITRHGKPAGLLILKKAVVSLFFGQAFEIAFRSRRQAFTRRETYSVCTLTDGGRPANAEMKQLQRLA